MIRKFGRPQVSKHEIIADLAFLFVAMSCAFIAIFIFDIHWSFYPGNTIFPPNKHIFKDATPYYFGIPVGGLVGLFLLKILFYAFREEEEAIKFDQKKTNYRSKTKRAK